MNVYQPALQSAWRSSQNVRAMSLGGGSRKRWTSSAATRPSQRPIPSTSTTTAGSHERAPRIVRPSRRSPATGVAWRHRRSSTSSERVAGSRAEPPCSASRSCVTSSKKRGSSRVSNVRGCGRSIGMISVIRPGRGRHHDDSGREEHRLGDRVRDEEDGAARLRPDPQQLPVQPLARHLVERAERLVHQEQRGRERERARDRDPLLHPAGELPRVAFLEAGQLDELDHLLDARVAPRAVPPGHLERQSDVAGDRAPVVEHRVLEDDPVVAVSARLVGGLAVHDDLAGARLDQVADDRSNVDLPQPDGPISEMNSPGSHVEVDLLQRGHLAVGQTSCRLLQRDGGGGAHATCSGARRTTKCSTIATIAKNEMPSSAAMRFVAQRLGGELR